MQIQRLQHFDSGEFLTPQGDVASLALGRPAQQLKLVVVVGGLAWNA